MRGFIVFAACITACVAATNGYGHVRLDIPSYAAPIETRTTTTTPAPIVYKSYDQPAFRIVNTRLPASHVNVVRVNEQPEVKVLRTEQQPTSYIRVTTDEQPKEAVRVLKTHRRPTQLTQEKTRLRATEQPIHQVNVLNTQQQPTQEFTRVSTTHRKPTQERTRLRTTAGQPIHQVNVLDTQQQQPTQEFTRVTTTHQRKPASHVKTVRPASQVLRVNEQPAAPEVQVLRTSQQPSSSSHVKILRGNQQPAAAPAELRLAAKKEHVPILRYVLNDNNNGNYQIETLSGDQTKMTMEGSMKQVAGPEAEGPVSVMKGSYSYVGPDQKTYTVTYVADERGFMPMGEHLPTPHPEIQAALNMMGPGSD